MNFKYEYLCDYTYAHNYIDSVILVDNWVVKLSTNKLKTIQKEIQIYEDGFELVTIKIKLDTVKGEAYFEIPHCP